MDVETTSERIVPSENWVGVIHPHMPTIDKQLHIDGSIEHRNTFDIYHEPTDLSSKTPLEFIIHPTPNYYVDLQSFYIDVKLHITNAAGGRAGVNDWNTYFINNLTQSLWSVIKVYLNDTNVESSFYSQELSNLRHILSTSNVLCEEIGEVQGAFQIKPESSVMVTSLGHEENALIAERIVWSKGDVVHIKGPLHLDLSTCDRFLIDGVKLRIVLEPA